MAQVRQGYRAVFYAHGQIMHWGPVRETQEACVQDIYEYNADADMGLRDPWTHAEIHAVYYPVYVD